MAKVDGFTISFTHRGSWTADLLAPGKEVEVVPVVWKTDYQMKEKTLFMWLKRPEEVAAFMKLPRFRVAMAFKNSDGSGSAENITGIFWVRPLDASPPPRQGVICAVEGRSKASDR